MANFNFAAFLEGFTGGSWLYEAKHPAIPDRLFARDDADVEDFVGAEMPPYLRPLRNPVVTEHSTETQEQTRASRTSQAIHERYAREAAAQDDLELLKKKEREIERHGIRKA
jgi:hypothetical protein